MEIRAAKAIMKIAKSLLSEFFDEPTSIDGMSKQNAVKKVNRIIEKSGVTKGLHRDNSWVPFHKMMKYLDHEGVYVYIEDAKYTKDEQGNPNSKRWNLVVEFTNNRGKKDKIYGVAIASGAGSPNDPLEVYDFTAYVS